MPSRIMSRPDSPLVTSSTPTTRHEVRGALVSDSVHLFTNERRTLRICHFGKYYPPAAGGMESHVQTLARAQAELGAEVQVVCVNHRDAGGRDVTWQPFRSTPTVRERDGKVAVTRVGRWASLARMDLCPELPWILRALQRTGMDVFHLHTPNPTMLAVMAVGGRTPLVITHHSDVIRQTLLRFVQRPLEWWVYRRAAGLFTDSPTYMDGSALLRSYSAKVQVLPLGIDLDPYVAPAIGAQEAAARWRRRFGTPLWLCVGRLVYYKGLQHAIAALAQTPGKLLIIGTGPLRSALEALAEKEAVADRVFWQPYATNDELIGAYHAATALWFPSNERSEGFGLVQVEAMASGCPVLNTAIPGSGVAWVSPHEETGLTVPMNDAAALAAAARRLQEEPGLRDRLAEGGRARAQREFGCREMATRSLEIYRQVLMGAR